MRDNTIPTALLKEGVKFDEAYKWDEETRRLPRGSLERIYDRGSQEATNTEFIMAKANSLTDMQQHLAEVDKEVHRTRRSPWGPQISHSFFSPRMYWMPW